MGGSGYFAVVAMAEGGAGVVGGGDVDGVAEFAAVAAAFVEHGVLGCGRKSVVEQIWVRALLFYWSKAGSSVLVVKGTHWRSSVNIECWVFGLSMDGTG